MVNRKKVDLVRDFLRSTLGQQPRVLLLRGPPGSGKAAVLRALCADLGFELVEWSPATRGAAGHAGQAGVAGAAAGSGALRAEPLGDAFLRFLAQTDRYCGLQVASAGGVRIRRPRMTLVQDFPFTLLDGRGDGSRSADFVERFHALMRSGSVHRATFCFNDALDDHKIVNRLFTQMGGVSLTTLHFDGVARTFAQRALDATARAEGFEPSSLSTATLAAECGGDLRHALNALQLAAGGATRACPPPIAGAKAKRARGGGRSKAAQVPATTPDVESATSGEHAGVTSDVGMRSAALGLFHALGRLMYCKRLPPEGHIDGLQQSQLGPNVKRLKRSNSASSGAAPMAEPRQLPHEFLVPKSSRPPLYFVPEDVMDASNSEPSAVVDWVFTNAPRFYGDIGDLAAFAASVAHVDTWANSIWRPGRGEAIASPLDALASAVQVRSLLDANLHPVPPGFADPCGSGQGPGSEGLGPAAAAFNMARPLMRDAGRHRERRLEELNAYLGITGPQALGAAVAGHILITQTLPFAHLMLLVTRGGHRALQRLPHAMMKLIMDLQGPLDSDLFRSGVKDGPAVPSMAEANGGHAPEPWASSLAEDPIEET